MERKTVQLLSIGLFITLLTWGTWTLLYYLGVPVHTGVLVGIDASNALNSICPTGGALCRGVNSFFPFLQHTLTRVPFILWYTVACALIYAGGLLWNFVRTNKFRLHMTMKPWKVLLMFVASMWMLFTCLSFTQSSNLPIRTLVEPHADVYQGAGEEALEALQRNYNNLKERGCLTRVGVFGNVAEASEIKMRCIQGSFFTRVLPPLLVVLLLLSQFLIAGRFTLRRLFRIRPQTLLLETVVSLCIGACVWVVLLWLGAVLGIYTVLYGWALLLVVPLIGHRDTRYWLKQFWSAAWEIEGKWFSVQALLFWILLTYLAFNFINVVRPFPIGWDDLGSYLNRPRLLVSYGTFVFSMASFQWEYMTSLGFLLFGYNAVFGATSALIINWSQGLLAVLAVYLFGRTFIGKGHGLLSALLYYSLPLVGHFSFADMKIDNAVFTMGAMGMFAMFVALFKEEDIKTKRKWIALAGLFVAFAFSFKVTAVMVMFALGAVLFGVALHWSAGIAAIFFSIAILIQRGALGLPALLDRVGYSPDIPKIYVAASFLLLGAATLGYASLKAKKNVRSTSVMTLVFVCAFAATIFPWVEHNNILLGNIVPQLELRAPNHITPTLDMAGTNPDAEYSLPPELAIDPQHPACKPSGAKEELDRYWGYRNGWGHYITLPFRAVMNLDSAGYYVTTQPALLLFPLLLLLPFFWRKEGKWFRWLWIATAFLITQWSFLGNGILWYGIGMFLGLVLSLEVLVAKSPDKPSRFLATFFVVIALISCLGMRYWQYDTQKNLFEYPLGKINAESIRERTIPLYDDITDVVLELAERNPDRPLLYRVGTFMPYFIPRNLEIIGVSDHQLDFFSCMYQDRNNIKMAQRLKALGFSSIVFDTNTATIEKDANGSLHKKVKSFVDFLNHPDSGLNVVIYNPSAGVSFILIP